MQTHRAILLLTVLLAIEPRSASSQVQNFEMQGNLQVTNNLNCIALSQVKSTYTPADLFTGVNQCVAKKRYDEAFTLYMMAGVFGRFDTLRVADKTAHQALSVLRFGTFGAWTEAQNKGFAEVSMRRGPQVSQMCREAAALGPPSYHPAYMINHGMGVMSSALKGAKAPEPLVANFDAASAWRQALADIMKCQ